MHEIPKILLLYTTGVFTGFMNVMAGGGSAIILPLLIFLGLDGALANGTNRVAIFIQNISAILSFRQEKVHSFRHSTIMSLFALPGAILGAFLAVHINNALFHKILGIVMIGIMITIVLPKKKIKFSENPKHAWLIYPAMVGIGFYGGFIQVGVGFILMAALQNILKIDLVKVNMHKVFVIFFYTIPALAVFILTGNVRWEYGLALAAGNATGAWFSAKVAVKKGEKVVRIVLMVAILIMSAKLLGVF